MTKQTRYLSFLFRKVVVTDSICFQMSKHVDSISDSDIASKSWSDKKYEEQGGVVGSDENPLDVPENEVRSSFSKPFILLLSDFNVI